MGKVINMVWVNSDTYLFLYGITLKGILTFRSSRNLSYLQREPIQVKEGICYTNFYFFNIEHLKNLPILDP